VIPFVLGFITAYRPMLSYFPPAYRNIFAEQ